MATTATPRQRVRRPEEPIDLSKQHSPMEFQPASIPVDDEHYGKGANLPAAAGSDDPPSDLKAPVLAQGLRLPLKADPVNIGQITDRDGNRVAFCGVDLDPTRSGAEIAEHLASGANAAEDAKYLAGALKSLKETLNQRSVSDASAIMIAISRLKQLDPKKKTS